MTYNGTKWVSDVKMQDDRYWTINNDTLLNAVWHKEEVWANMTTDRRGYIGDGPDLGNYSPRSKSIQNGELNSQSAGLDPCLWKMWQNDPLLSFSSSFLPCPFLSFLFEFASIMGSRKSVARAWYYSFWLWDGPPEAFPSGMYNLCSIATCVTGRGRARWGRPKREPNLVRFSQVRWQPREPPPNKQKDNSSGNGWRLNLVGIIEIVKSVCPVIRRTPLGLLDYLKKRVFL